MFGDDKNDSWKGVPAVLVVGALLFLFFDPFGMKDAGVRYFVGAAPAPVTTLIPPVAGAAPAANPQVAANNAVGNFPTELTTGPTTALTKTWPQSTNGTWIVLTQNADGFIFNGCVKTGAPGIHITNSEIRGNCSTAQLYDEAGGGVFEYNNIFDVAHHGTSTVGCGAGSRFFRNNAKGAVNGVLEGTNCHIVENYIHDLDEFVTSYGGTHNTGVQIENGTTTGMLVQKNTFENTCGKTGITGQGCVGVVFINNGASGNTIDGNYVKRWDGPNAGFIFHTQSAGVNVVKNNVIECGSVTGFGISSGGPSIFTNNTSC